MEDTLQTASSSTTEAAKATSQSRGDTERAIAAEGATATSPQFVHEDVRYRVGAGIRYALDSVPYLRRPDDPLYRPLRIYALDPSIPRRSGRVALVNIPFEPLEKGPCGAMFEVADYDDTRGVFYQPFDPNDPGILIRNGLAPSPSDPRFHQQMVYAVCSLVYAAFRTALGRHIAWGFDPRLRRTDADDPPARLVIRPHAACGERNAYYDPEKGELCFGYYQASPDEVAGNNLPSGWVFTCLSHDIVAHEVTHALLDGLRTRFDVPTRTDVLAFHEAFADLVALFQHFTYTEIVDAAIRESGGKLEGARLLTDIAVQFGQTTGRGENALRSALDDAGGRADLQPARVYDPSLEGHKLGAVLVAAVFEAYLTVYRRKVARYVRLATGGSGVPPAGDLPADLRAALAEEAAKLAGQFLSICIRAIDYCPPVDLRFGEYLRAIITADYDLVPDDPWGYREALIDAFRRRRIYPEHVASLSEDSLLWRRPVIELRDEPELSFARLRFRGDPACPASATELYRQACILGEYITIPDYCTEFGLVVPGCREWNDNDFDLPEVESIRTSRRAGPDQQIVFDLVAEVTQRHTLRLPDGSSLPFWGGATVILGPDGAIRYVIRKSVDSVRRQKEQSAFVQQGEGRNFWSKSETSEYRLRPNLFRMLHDA